MWVYIRPGRKRERGGEGGTEAAKEEQEGGKAEGAREREQEQEEEEEGACLQSAGSLPGGVVFLSPISLTTSLILMRT
eukprot:3308990-Rhodomonas_salina.1